MRSPTSSSFARLASYLIDTQGKDERVEAFNITNCEAATQQAAFTEILATQLSNTRAKTDKTWHMVVSFRAGEQIDASTLRSIEAEIVSALGFAEHQRISVVHSDTDNLHMHIVINRVHPVKLTVHDPHQSYRTLAKTCAALEKKYGLAVDNHEARQTISAGRAGDMERHSGMESLVGWIRREKINAKMLAVNSWAELHDVLNQYGLVVRKRGNGLIIATANGRVTVKASTVARDLSKSKLEKKYGSAFTAQEPASNLAPPIKRYSKRPVRLSRDTDVLWARYQKERHSNEISRRAGLNTLRQQRVAAVSMARAENRKRRASIQAARTNRIQKRHLYGQASADLSTAQLQASADYWQARRNLRATRPVLAWADWLRREAERGDPSALAALRSRESAARKRADGNHIAPAWSGKLTVREAYYEACETMAARHDRERLKLLQHYRTKRSSLDPRSMGQSWIVANSLLASKQARHRLDLKDQQAAERAKLLRIYTESTSSGVRVTKTGTVIRAGVRDDGINIRASSSGAALNAARARSFGATLEVVGSPRYKAQAILAAAAQNIVLADPKLEARKQEIMRGQRRPKNRGGDSRINAGRSGKHGRRSASGQPSPRIHEKAAATFNNLSCVSVRSLAQIKSRAQMLLSNYARRDLEHQRATRPIGLRSDTRAVAPSVSVKR